MRSPDIRRLIPGSTLYALKDGARATVVRELDPEERVACKALDPGSRTTSLLVRAWEVCWADRNGARISPPFYVTDASLRRRWATRRPRTRTHRGLVLDLYTAAMLRRLDEYPSALAYWRSASPEDVEAAARVVRRAIPAGSPVAFGGSTFCRVGDLVFWTPEEVLRAYSE